MSLGHRAEKHEPEKKERARDSERAAEDAECDFATTVFPLLREIHGRVGKSWVYQHRRSPLTGVTTPP